MVRVVELSRGGARVAWHDVNVGAGAALTLLFQSAPFRFHNCPAKVLRQTDGVLVLKFEEILQGELVDTLAG